MNRAETLVSSGSVGVGMVNLIECYWCVVIMYDSLEIISLPSHIESFIWRSAEGVN